MSKSGKKYRAVREKIEEARQYDPEEAVTLLKQLVYARFNETVELVVGLGIDARRSDQMVRGTVTLPHGTGKKVKVLVFCKPELVEEAQAAGADFAGGKELIEKIKGGWLDFDIAVAGKDMMREVSQLGKVLGPRGLMPSPKAGTVTEDIPRTVREVKAGKIELKSDKFGYIQVAVGKVSFPERNLLENIQSVVQEIKRLRPPATKGKYIQQAHICSTMSPAVKMDPVKLAGS